MTTEVAMAPVRVNEAEHEDQYVGQKPRTKEHTEEKVESATVETIDLDDNTEQVETGIADGDTNSSEIRNAEGTQAGRTLRKRNEQMYDQVRRRTRSKVSTTQYLERREGRRLCQRRAIVMGTATIENIVAGRYEWRDGDMRTVSGRRKRYWEETQQPPGVTY